MATLDSLTLVVKENLQGVRVIRALQEGTGRKTL